MECVLTFALVFVVYAATDNARGVNTVHIPVLAPLSIGITVFVAHLVGIPIDGCSINPARSFGKWASVGLLLRVDGGHKPAVLVIIARQLLSWVAGMALV
jgi:glycerol uptake facilitator-like aquaporin